MPPGALQVPQLGLQHTMPELQVLGPHSTLSAERLKLGPLGVAAFGIGEGVAAAAPFGAAGAAAAAGLMRVCGAGTCGMGCGFAGTASGATTLGEVTAGGGTFMITTLRSVG